MGAKVALSEVWEKGGDGGIDLATEVLKATEIKNEPVRLYDWAESIEEKIEKIAKKVYRAGKVDYTSEARKHIKMYGKEYSHLPVIIAKTQASISDDPKKIGAPSGYTFTVKDCTVSAGAGFLVVYAGDIMTMPGLPKHPSAMDIDIDKNGEIKGLF